MCRLCSVHPSGQETTESNLQRDLHKTQWSSRRSHFLVQMDTLTAKHGLTSVAPSQPVHQADVDSLPSDLQRELERLQKEFWVSTDKLKEISHQFERELQDGLDRYGANIVSRTVGYLDLSAYIRAVHERHLGTGLARRTREWIFPDG